MKLVVIDRDGVINTDGVGQYVRTEAEWKALPGSLEAIAMLCRHDYRIAVITNQAGLARGWLNIETLNAIHRKMLTHLAQFGGNVEVILFCPHGENEGCDCRKPKTGMYKELSRRLRLPLAGIPAIGDKLSDIEAARAAGASPIMVRTGYGQGHVDRGEVPAGVPVFADLAAAAADLVARA